MARGSSGFATTSMVAVDWGAGAARAVVKREMERERVVRRGRSMVMIWGVLLGEGNRGFVWSGLGGMKGVLDDDSWQEDGGLRPPLYTPFH